MSLLGKISLALKLTKECSETESDFDSSEEEEERVVNVDEEHADSQSVEVGRRIWYSNQH